MSGLLQNLFPSCIFRKLINTKGNSSYEPHKLNKCLEFTLAKSIHILDPQNILSGSEKLLCVDLQLPKHQLSVTHHLLQTTTPNTSEHFVHLSSTRDVTGERCTMFLNVMHIF